MATQMARGIGGESIQAFPLSKSTNVNLTTASGEVSGIYLIHCAVDGDVSITFSDSVTPATVSFVAGDQFSFSFGVTIDFTGTAGTFHVSTN